MAHESPEIKTVNCSNSQSKSNELTIGQSGLTLWLKSLVNSQSRAPLSKSIAGQGKWTDWGDIPFRISQCDGDRSARHQWRLERERNCGWAGLNIWFSWGMVSWDINVFPLGNQNISFCNRAFEPQKYNRNDRISLFFQTTQLNALKVRVPLIKRIKCDLLESQIWLRCPPTRAWQGVTPNSNSIGANLIQYLKSTHPRLLDDSAVQQYCDTDIDQRYDLTRKNLSWGATPQWSGAFLRSVSRKLHKRRRLTSFHEAFKKPLSRFEL